MTIRRKAVLVVGGAGYIGSHMVKALCAEGYRVLVLDDLSTGHRKLVTGGQWIQGKMGDGGLLDRILEANPVDSVMHFAACSIVGESVRSPLPYYQNNVAETIALLEALRRHKIRKLIFSSSAAVYGEPDRVPIRETQNCRPTNPYGKTKLCIEGLLADCGTAYGLRSICLRYFNAAGADASGRIGELHDPETHLIPLVLRCAQTAQPIKVYGCDYPTPDGTCIRDYVHVNDLAQAHLLALAALEDGHGSDVFNLGNNTGHSVRQVIELAAKVSGRPIHSLDCERRPGDPAVLVADSSRIRSRLNWQPRYEALETMIESAWKWHTGNH